MSGRSPKIVIDVIDQLRDVDNTGKANNDILKYNSTSGNMEYSGLDELGAIKIGRDVDNLIDFSVDNQITFRVNGVDQIYIDSNGDFQMNANNLVTTGSINGAYLGVSGNEAYFRDVAYDYSGEANTMFGKGAGYSLTTGSSSNVLMGHNAGYYITTGDFNTIIGKDAGFECTGQNNTFFGIDAGYTPVGKNNNTGIGAYSGLYSEGQDNVFLGHYAGAYETADNKLFIDNQSRGNEALSRTNSLIYGIFDSVVANQSINFNVGSGSFGSGSLTCGALTATGNIDFDGGTFVFNNSEADKDFRVAASGITNAFFVQSSDGYVGINTNSPANNLFIQGPSSDTQAVIGLDHIATSPYTFSFSALSFKENGNYLGGLNYFSANYSADTDFQSALVVTGAENNVGKIIFRTRTSGTYYPRIICENDGELKINGDSQKLTFGADQDVSLYWDNTNSRLTIDEKTIITSANFPALDVERTTASTNSIAGAFRLCAVTSGNMSDGFGTGFNYCIEDSTSGTQNIGRTSCERDGADNSGKLLWSTFKTGSRNDWTSLNSDGVLSHGDGTNYVEIESDGDFNFVAGAGLQFGEIYFHGAGTDLALAAQDTYYQIVAFDTNGESNASVTPDHTNDHITVGKAGRYLISYSISSRSAQSNKYQYSIFYNNGGTELVNSHTHRDTTVAGKLGVSANTCIADLPASATIELWVQRLDGGAVSKTITFEHLTMNVVQIGGTT